MNPARISIMVDQHDQISALEQEIESLAEAAERCRKLTLAAKVAISVGGLLLVLTLVGVLGRSSGSLLAGLASLLGGVALYGSNQSTLDEIRAAISEREGRRADLISIIELRSLLT